LNQRKIDAAKLYFRVDSEQEAIDKALSLLIGGTEIEQSVATAEGYLKG
jgi:hypothetical protein